jgi:nitroreductase
MTIHDLIVSRRTIRQFQSKPLDRAILEQAVEAGRLAPSAANKQPLEFVIVDDVEIRARIFPCLKWAAYIQPAGDPLPGQEPTAYIFVLVNSKIREKMYEYDVGAAVENICLSALGQGIASCWLISIDKPKIAGILGIPEGHLIDSVVALGYPAETSVAEEWKDSPKYWKDATGGFHVPKRKLKDVMHVNKF